MNSYPTVATIIGCPEELKSTDGLVATPLVIEEEMSMPEPSVQQLLPNDTSGIKDPVQRAIVDNVLGKNSTKTLPEKHKCEICSIEVNGKAALLTHLSGARHAKKVKEDNLNKESQNPLIEYLESTRMYHCKLCNTTLNARVQIMAHLQGNKHRGKLDSSGKIEPSPQPGANKPQVNSTNAVVPKKKDLSNPGNGPVGLQLFCATCRIYANSEVQLQQHTSSKKHQNKLSGNGMVRARPAPYPLRSPKAGPLRPSSSPIPSYSRQSYQSPSNVIYQRRVSSSYNGQQYNSYGSLSNNFVSSGVYGGGNGYSNQSYNRHSSFQSHTYG